MLLRQDFRGGHQGGLKAVPGGGIGGSRRHHGFAAAHVSLNQAIHGTPLPEIRQNIFDSPLLGPGKFKGQCLVEFRQIQLGIGDHLFFRPGGPHQGQPRRKHEEFLENHPFLCLGRLFHGLGLVDGPVGSLRR